MKIGIMRHKGEFISYLLLETIEDVHDYSETWISHNGHANIQALFSSKNTDDYKNIVTHQQTNSVGKILAFQLEMKATDTSITKFCQMHDEIMFKKLDSFIRHIISGKVLRLNGAGGYCFTDYSEFIEVLEPTELQVNNFIIHGNFEYKGLDFNHKTVVLENSNELDLSLRIEMNEKFPGFHPISSFKNITTGLKPETIINLLVEGLENGLENLVFETSGLDTFQLKESATLLAISLNQTKTHLNLYIKTSKKEIFSYFENIPNLSVNNI